jgi:hypothetical protein
MSEELLIRVLRDLPLFAENYLKIPTKGGEIENFVFNKAQKYLHKRLEEQLQKLGRVRALVLKGRQQGCSTYVQARFFHKVITQKGKKAFILTHDAQATKNLFEMTKRYHENLPDGLAPKPDADSAKSLDFSVLNSGYRVGTAGNKSAGRSQTVQLFHGSEVAYWENAEEHQKGVLQAVSNAQNTEIILESTANGIGNYFYNMWIAASTGQSEFQAIFIPWYWQSEYTANLRENETATLTEEEQKLFDTHHADGLTIEHLYWRRRKLAEFSNDHDTAVELFNVEYPMTALDAFRNPVADRFIKSDIVMRARKNKVESQSPLVIGVDPAYGNTDRLAIIRRKGRLVYGLETHFNMQSTEIVYHLVNIINREHPSKMCIDSIGGGGPICDRLIELGYGHIIEPVNVARQSNDKDKYINLRAELWDQMKTWFTQEMPVQVPDSDELMGDLTSLGYHYRTAGGKLQIESKEELKKRGIKSPDTADALALTFFVGDYVSQGSYKPNFMPDKANSMFI